jgi:hypothetical protein
MACKKALNWLFDLIITFGCGEKAPKLKATMKSSSSKMSVIPSNLKYRRPQLTQLDHFLPRCGLRLTSGCLCEFGFFYPTAKTLSQVSLFILDSWKPLNSNAGLPGSWSGPPVFFLSRLK